MAALHSMTGYGRSHGSLPGVSFVVELKSVNGRGLDMRVRLAPGFDALEPEIRRRIGRGVSRGSLTVSLTVDREGEGGRVVVNHQALEAVLEGFKWLAGRVAGPSAWDGYATTAVAEAAVESLAKGGRVAVELVDRPALYACAVWHGAI